MRLLSTVLSTLVLGLFMSCAEPPPPIGLNGGTPEFRLASLDGGRLGPADFRGRVVLFDFWATWCAPCHVQADILKAIYEEFREFDVEFVAVSVGEDEGTVRSFVNERPFPYPVLLDPSDEAASRLGVFVLPTIMVLDAEGRIAYLREGVSSARRLRTTLTEALMDSTPAAL